MTPSAPSPPALARHMGLFFLIVYGVGDMVGAGIYATIGKAAGLMGNAVWLAFAASMVAALLTGLSYACLASRHPRAAGAAYITQQAFGWRGLSYGVGLAVTASGLTSMAGGADAFARALASMLPAAVPGRLIVIGYLLAIALLNFWGIRQSMWGNLVCTAVEVGGIVFVIATGMRFWGETDLLIGPDGVSVPAVGAVLSGAVLTFFSFVGFEDMINVAEEVRDAERTLPRGIIIALAITTLLYIGVSVTAVSAVTPARLADFSAGPAFEQITRRTAPWLPAGTFTLITLFAVANTGLINYIMGSRLVYGMARQGLLPAWLGAVHGGRRTPHRAIAALWVVVMLLALLGDIRQLGEATALLLLSCFCVVNAALVVLKLRKAEPHGHFEVPLAVPVAGVLVCGLLVAARLTDTATDRRAPLIAAGILLLIAGLYWILHPRQVVVEESCGD